MFVLKLLGFTVVFGCACCAPSESESPLFFDSSSGHHGIVTRDPCFDLYCGHGQICQRSDDGLSAECVCRPNCPSNRRHRVCGSDGVLYANHCELHRTACREKRVIMVEELEHCIFPGFDEENDVNQGTKKNTKENEISRLVINKRKYPKITTDDPWGEETFQTDSSPSSSSTTTTTTQSPSSCQTVEYEMMKDNLMLYHHEKTIGKRRSSEADYLLSIVFLHYDRNNDGLLERSELLLDTMEEQDEVKHLSEGCTLEDLLRFDDTNGDGVLSGDEFNEAFSKLYSVSVISLDKSLETNHIQARVGENIEIKCDVTGTPKPTKIVWNRAGVDLATLRNEGSSIQVFHDGSLYINDLQFYHAGKYFCHAERNKDVVQTHVLNVTGVPKVQVTPPIQALAPKDDAEIECWVSSQVPAKISWLKNDEHLPLARTEKYEVIGDGRVLTVRSLTYADTGAYMCEAVGRDGSMRRGISSLVIQDDPQPTVKPAPNLLLVFSGEGIGLYDPESCRILRQIQSSDVIPGTGNYVCSSDANQLCRWGEVVNVNDTYVYATQPHENRILVLNLAQMGVIEALETDTYPVRLQYVKTWDQLWVVNWRSPADAGNKTMQVLRRASQRGPHELVHPQPIQSHFDVAYRLFLPAEEELGVKWRFGYVGHSNQRGMYKLNLEDLRLVRSVDLAPYNCVPNNVVFVARYGLVVVECKEPISGKPSGQIILDYLSDTVVQYKPDVFGKPSVSPDSLFVVTSDHETDGSFLLAIQKVQGDGLHFQFDAKTSLDISDVGFVPSLDRHSFDLYASSGLKSDLMFLNLESGHVEVLTSVGEPPEAARPSWGLPLRPLAVCPDRFHPYVAVTGRQSVSVADGRDKAVNCEISGLIEPQRVVWVRIPVS